MTRAKTDKLAQQQNQAKALIAKYQEQLETAIRQHQEEAASIHYYAMVREIAVFNTRQIRLRNLVRQWEADTEKVWPHHAHHGHLQCRDIPSFQNLLSAAKPKPNRRPVVKLPPRSVSNAIVATPTRPGNFATEPRAQETHPIKIEPGVKRERSPSGASLGEGPHMKRRRLSASSGVYTQSAIDQFLKSPERVSIPATAKELEPDVLRPLLISTKSVESAEESAARDIPANSSAPRPPNASDLTHAPDVPIVPNYTKTSVSLNAPSPTQAINTTTDSSHTERQPAVLAEWSGILVNALDIKYQEYMALSREHRRIEEELQVLGYTRPADAQNGPPDALPQSSGLPSVDT